MCIVCRVSCHYWQSPFFVFAIWKHCTQSDDFLVTENPVPANPYYIRDSLSVSFQVNICQKHLSMSLKQLRPIHYSEGSIEWHSPERAMWSCQMKWIDVPGT